MLVAVAAVLMEVVLVMEVMLVAAEVMVSLIVEEVVDLVMTLVLVVVIIMTVKGKAVVEVMTVKLIWDIIIYDRDLLQDICSVQHATEATFLCRSLSKVMHN